MEKKKVVTKSGCGCGNKVKVMDTENTNYVTVTSINNDQPTKKVPHPKKSFISRYIKKIVEFFRLEK
ncbi:hypothetical protein [Pontibacillus yanchengensis]|uniref:Uncharacterized protein n=1 Tax=Pontibacillus yanchengensis Y32 TaxID=1385514 RepID=A0A0A2TYC3_9BACI|nr:hypothetical protein [Pontibacillus yanchengensis]KGP74250.1 hypothetical protein N782_09170 [Pontibacillus yanchengensis Y32]